ncbi:hypothetical protein CLI75_11945, partial [Porphyromonas gingivalis]
ILRTGKGKAELIDQVDSMLDMELESFLSMEKQGDISDAFLSADTPLERDTDRYFSILEKNGCYQSGQIGISRAWDICP